MDELFFYTGKNHESLARFLQIEEDDYELQLQKDETNKFIYDDLHVTANSLVYYDYASDQYDFFLLDL